MGEFTQLDLDSLEFDKMNPRLPSSLANASNDEVLRYLASKTGIENLMVSIGENGFFPGEAIVVTPDRCGKYIVIEGNRRLTALRLLQDPALAGNRPGVARVASEAKHRPNRIPAYVAKSRDETLQYLGFRHISGVQRWDPLAKARYLEVLFDKLEGTPNQRYNTVACEIGSARTTVRRNLDALAAYKIIEQEDFYDIEGMEETTLQFGTFYTAIDNTDIARFINVRAEDGPTHPIASPEVVNKEHLKELARWMFEQNSSGITKLGESRNIGKLGDVVANPQSLEALRSGLSLGGSIPNHFQWKGCVYAAHEPSYRGTQAG